MIRQTGAIHGLQCAAANSSASPVHAARRIYAISKQGVCTVIAARGEYQEVAVNDRQEPTLASFAIDGRTILVRTERHLDRIE